MKTLDLAPRNTTIAEAAATLLDGYAVGIVLEPGDMTVYRILIAPCWTPAFAPLAGGGIGDGSDYLLVATQFVGHYPIVRLAAPSYVADKVGRGNAHTGEVVAGFLDLLWKEIDARSTEDTEA